MDIDLTLIQTRGGEEPSYRVKFDGIEIGSISYRLQMGVGRETYWEWGVETMPLIGGRTPNGKADSLEQAKREFRSAFERWIATIPADKWARNRAYKAYASRPDRYTKQRPTPRAS